MNDWRYVAMLGVLAVVAGVWYAWGRSPGNTPDAIGGGRDAHGCLVAGGYAFDETVGACIRAFEMTTDILRAAKLAVDEVGRGYALTVVSFNSYEETGAYDIMFERGAEREAQTIYIRNWRVERGTRN